jgi:hypothetical protein
MANILAFIIVIVGLPLLIEWVHDPCLATEKRIAAIVLPALDEKEALGLPLAEATAGGRFFLNQLIQEKDKEMHPAALRGLCTMIYYKALFFPDGFKSSSK